MTTYLTPLQPVLHYPVEEHDMNQVTQNVRHVVTSCYQHVDNVT